MPCCELNTCIINQEECVTRNTGVYRKQKHMTLMVLNLRAMPKLYLYINTSHKHQYYYIVILF